jgi:hypothetical protein
MTEQAVSPLRRRMIEDMSIRKFGAKTQHDYVQRVKDFAAFLGRSPDTAKSEDVRRFRLHLSSSGAGTPKINATVSALRFFFKVTLDRPDLTKHLSFMHEPRKVPVVLSAEEVSRFLEAAPSIKYKAALPKIGPALQFGSRSPPSHAPRQHDTQSRDAAPSPGSPRSTHRCATQPGNVPAALASLDASAGCASKNAGDSFSQIRSIIKD